MISVEVLYGLDKMADKHAVNYDIRELKLGASFTNNKATQYHTIKCMYFYYRSVSNKSV